MEKYYIEKMNSKRETGKILGIIPIPENGFIYFLISTFLISFIIEKYVGTYFISSLFGIVLSVDMYYKNKKRDYILEKCIAEEIFMGFDLKEYGVGEFSEDPLYVTDSDRDSIFEEVFKNYFPTTTSGKQKIPSS
jgi:hypothetical protein